MGDPNLRPSNPLDSQSLSSKSLHLDLRSLNRALSPLDIFS